MPVLSENSDLHDMKYGMHQLLSRIHILVQKFTTFNEMKMAKCHLNSAVSILQLVQPTVQLITQVKSPNNACIQPQRFNSTRKRKRSGMMRLTKPTINEKQSVIRSLKENKPLYEEKIIIGMIIYSIILNTDVLKYFCNGDI